MTFINVLYIIKSKLRGELFMNFGTRLSNLIKERGISQKDFATAISVAASTAGNYIRGIREPDYSTLKRIANYFQVSVDFLLDSEIDSSQTESENELIHIYRMLDQDRQELLLDQAKLLLNRYGGNH